MADRSAQPRPGTSAPASSTARWPTSITGPARQPPARRAARLPRAGGGHRRRHEPAFKRVLTWTPSATARSTAACYAMSRRATPCASRSSFRPASPGRCPAYELALMTAWDAHGMGVNDVQITIYTESASLELFGAAAVGRAVTRASVLTRRRRVCGEGAGAAATAPLTARSFRSGAPTTRSTWPSSAVSSLSARICREPGGHDKRQPPTVTEDPRRSLSPLPACGPVRWRRRPESCCSGRSGRRNPVSESAIAAGRADRRTRRPITGR